MLEQRVAKAKAPDLVFQEADLSVRVVRDIFSAHFERAVVDDPKQHHRLVSFFARTAPELVDRVELWESDEPLFDAYGVDEVIEGMLAKRVDLPSGGYLLIDYAEALTVIDVNTGSFIGRGKSARLEDTITKTNLEAAEEVVNQLRLRDIGGIIVIDFIDMARARNRDAVLKTLRKALDEDRTKTFVVEISPLGLVEMTRQNVTEGVREIMTKTCPTCDGEGVVKSEETVAIEVDRKLREMVKDTATARARTPSSCAQPAVTAQFIGENARMLHALEADTGRFFSFEGSEGLPLDHFAITLEGTRDEVVHAAVPFSRRRRGPRATSSSRTCTRSTTPSPRSTATSSPCAAPGRSSARSGSCASRTPAAPPATAVADRPHRRGGASASPREGRGGEAQARAARRGGRAKKKDPEPAQESASQAEEDAKVKASTGPAGKTESDGGEEKPRRTRTGREDARRRARGGGARRGRGRRRMP